ncbi:MAG: type II toxin-antitoxin system HicA family toxin [Acidobacteria bacterium]|nr:type II toxin-antitoxin system HicA family toxin [Acidobacteriota bacterium]
MASPECRRPRSCRPLAPGRLAAAFEKDGWVESRWRGSHLIMRKPGRGAPVVIPMHKGDLPRGTLASILRGADMSRRRFAELLSG